MDIRLQLRQLLKIGESGAPSLSRIARDATLTRHELNHLLDEEATSINRQNLAKICRYLVANELVEEKELPGVLFAALPEEFWSMFLGRSHVEFCMGARGGPDAHDQYVSGADAALQAQLLFNMTGKPPAEHPRSVPGKIDLRILPTWERNLSNAAAVKQEVNRFVRRNRPADRALICLGSVKSNPMIEVVVDGMFKRARAFHSEDGVARPQDRSCPFLLLYRDSDPSPASCCGGRRLYGAESKPRGPGIYFETEDRTWQYVPYNSSHDDCALVLYRFQPMGRLEMVLGGFSGRGTRCLAAFLRAGGADQLWPGLSLSNGNVGAYVIHFELRKTKQKQSTTAARPYHTAEVHCISEHALQHRLR